MAADNERFLFHPTQRDVLSSIKSKSKETTELFEKWGMHQRMKFAVFSYNRPFQLYQKETLVKDFFNSGVVNSHMETLSSSGQWSPLGMSDSIDSVTVEEVPCTVMSMEFFERLTTAGVVKPTGEITKCFDEVAEDFLVSDELRKVLLMEDSDHYELFTAEERSEFLFRILKHIALGGPVNQYEDNIRPYLDTAKLLYKELVLVVKESHTNKLSIATSVLKVQAKVGQELVFPWHSEHIQNFCYLLIDNAKRHVTAWYHIWH